MGIRFLLLALGVGLLAGPPRAAETGSPFLRHCARCHGSDGSGRGPRGERLSGGRINDPKRLAAQDPEALVALILDGRNAMPGFRARFGADEARKIARHVLNGLPKSR